MWETVEGGETELQLFWLSVVEQLRRATSPAPGIVIYFLGFEPMALAIPSPNRTEKETYFERNVETKSV